MKQVKGITKRGEKWQIRTTYKGHYIYKQFARGDKATHSLAVRYLNEEKKRIDMGQYYEEHKTLEEVYLFMDKEKRSKGRKKEQSSIITDNLFYNHIAKVLNKDRYIDSYADYEIIDFQDDIINSGLATSTQSKIIFLLKQIFRTALKHKWLATDHTVLIDCPTATKGKIKVFTEEETKLLYKEAENRFKDNPNYLGMLVLGIEGGLRLAEMRGLRWKDVDFENHELHVMEQFNNTLNKYTELKTQGSKRTLGMLPPFEKSLRRIYEGARERAGFKDTDCVLTVRRGQYTGKPLSFNCFYDMLGKLTVKCGLTKESKLHVLRKTCSTNMLNRGIPLHYVSAWLGHSKSTMTWAVYTDKDSIRKEAFNRMYQDYIAQKGA